MVARSRGAVRAALLQAIDMRFAEIRAARALGEVAAERRDMPDLRRGKPLRARSQRRIGFDDARVGSDCLNRRQRADRSRAIRSPRDCRIALAGNVDHRALRDAAAPAFGKIGSGGAQFRCCSLRGHR
jgi:hypothetical protein